MAKSYDNKPTSNASSSSTDERISVVKLAKSGGCVDRDSAFMKTLRESQIRSYFFGNPVPSIASTALSLSTTSSTTNVTLSPHAQQLDFDSLSVYNIVIAGDDGDDDDEYDPSRLSTDSSFLPGDSGERETTPNPILQQLQQQQQQQSQQGENNNTTTSSPAPFKKLSGTPSMALENTLLAITHAAANAPPSEIRDASIMGFLYVVDVDDKKGKIRVLAPVGGRVPPRAITWGRKWPGAVIGLVA